MDLFEKDMERIIAGKKAELLADLEEAKKRILHELYCVKEGVHTDACGLLADYNRIKAQLSELVTMHDASLRLAVEKYQKMILEIMGAYENKFEGLDEIIQTIDGKVAEFDALREQLEALIGQLDGYAKEADLDQLRAELSAMIDQLRAELPDAQVQADWNEGDETSKAFIKNKPFSRIGSERTILFKGNQSGNGYGKYTNISMTSPNTWNIYDEIEVTLLNRVTGEIVYSYKGRLAGTYCVVDMPTPMADWEGTLWHEATDGETFHIVIMWDRDRVKCRGCFDFEVTVEVGYTTINYERPDPWMLGNFATPGKHLALNESGVLVWTKDVVLESPSGIKFNITVSDDGVLSAVPVTN